MTLRSLICFSLAALAAHGAVVSGSVALRDSRVAAVNRQNDYSGVVISLKPARGEPPVISRHATMLQKNKMFSPHLLPVAAGTTVDFPNADPIFHNAFSNFKGQIFDVGLYPPGTSRSVHFSRPGVVRVFCNIHSAMSAVILVLNTPFFTMTARDGTYAMNVPPGDYELRVFHERATESVLADLAARITVGTEPVRLPRITVSEAGYLLAPHSNKYGHEYDAPPDDGVQYPRGNK